MPLPGEHRLSVAHFSDLKLNEVQIDLSDLEKCVHYTRRDVLECDKSLELYSEENTKKGQQDLAKNSDLFKSLSFIGFEFLTESHLDSYRIFILFWIFFQMHG